VRRGNLFRGWRALGRVYSVSTATGRHVDMILPLWNLFDVTPDGRGEKCNPKLAC